MVTIYLKWIGATLKQWGVALPNIRANLPLCRWGKFGTTGWNCVQEVSDKTHRRIPMKMWISGSFGGSNPKTMEISPMSKSGS
jgi:hypothetical protein